MFANRMTPYLALLIVVISSAIIAWPIFVPMVTSNDEWTYLYQQQRGLRFSEILQINWESRQWRIHDILAANFFNFESHAASTAMFWQMPAIVLIFLGMRIVLGYLDPENPTLSWFLSFIWLLLHSSFSVSLWGAATISQTWSAALGLWLCILVWQVRFRSEKTQPLSMLAILIVISIGVNTKETFFGWVFAAAMLFFISFYIRGRGKKRSFVVAREAVWMSILLCGIPAVHIALRWFTGGLPEIGSADAGRYHFDLGLESFRHIPVIVAGFFSVTPIHLAVVPWGTLGQKILAVTGVLAAAAIPVLFWMMSRSPQHRTRLARVRMGMLVVTLTSLLSTVVLLPAGHVSELYLMGPNIGIAILIGVSLAYSLQCLRGYISGGSRFQHFFCNWHWRMILVVGILSFVIGVYGLLSRAVHYAYTWDYHSRLWGEVKAMAKEGESDVAIKRVLLTGNCVEGATHSQYIMPPAQAFSLDYANSLLRNYSFYATGLGENTSRTDGGGGEDSVAEVILTCDEFPRRPHL